MGILKNFLAAVSDSDPFADVHRDLESMLVTAHEMVTGAHEEFWIGRPAEDIYARDIEINKLERGIRKSLALAAVTVGGPQATHALLLMNVVKDAERLGDYAKNIHELCELGTSEPPAGEVAREIRGLGEEVLSLLDGTVSVMREWDADAAQKLTTRGRELRSNCRDCVKTVTDGATSPVEAVQLALLCRFYKRLSAHCLNMLSSVFMPLHKVDYFDSKAASAS